MPSLKPRPTDPHAFDVLSDDGRSLGWVSNSFARRKLPVEYWVVSGPLWKGRAPTAEAGAAALAEVEVAHRRWMVDGRRQQLSDRFSRLADWGSARHAYGSATDVPEILADLFCPDARLRDSAVDRLCGSICHQGTVYSGSAVAVPVLVRLLTDEALPSPQRIVALLAHLATGFGPVPWKASDEQRREAESIRIAVREAVRAAFATVLGIERSDRRFTLAQLELAVAFPEEILPGRAFLSRARNQLTRSGDLAALDAAVAFCEENPTDDDAREDVASLIGEALGADW